MAMVHACMRPGCSTLTMGELCLEHEEPRRAARDLDVRARRRVSGRLAATAGLVVAAVVGGAIRLHLPR